MLLEQVRAGECDAYGTLYQRHAASARGYARSLLVNSSDADDAVSEVFASLLAALRHGRGPSGVFVPYLLASVRNQCRRL